MNVLDPARLRPSAHAPHTGLRVGLDIGGTKTEAVLLRPDGSLEHSLRLPSGHGEHAVLTTAHDAVRELATETHHNLSEFTAIGIGIPGQVDRSAGQVQNAVNLGISSLALGPELTARTGLPVTVDNDVTAAAVGAYSLLTLTGTVAYLNLGTGLAAGIVIDGKAWRGSTGVAGEIGHLPMDPLGFKCPCGQRGCLETMASGSALMRTWPAGGEHPGRGILTAIHDGDHAARLAFDRLVRGAAICVRMLVLSYDPSRIIIGGGLRLLGDPLIAGISEALGHWAAESPFLAGLNLAERIELLGATSPAAAVGAALVSDPAYVSL